MNNIKQYQDQLYNWAKLTNDQIIDPEHRNTQTMRAMAASLAYECNKVALLSFCQLCTSLSSTHWSHFTTSLSQAYQSNVVVAIFYLTSCFTNQIAVQAILRRIPKP